MLAQRWRLTNSILCWKPTWVRRSFGGLALGQMISSNLNSHHQLYWKSKFHLKEFAFLSFFPNNTSLVRGSFFCFFLLLLLRLFFFFPTSWLDFTACQSFRGLVYAEDVFVFFILAGYWNFFKNFFKTVFFFFFFFFFLNLFFKLCLMYFNFLFYLFILVFSFIYFLFYLFIYFIFLVYFLFYSFIFYFF